MKIAKRSEDDKSVLQTSGLQEIPTNSYLDLSKSKKMQIEKLFDVKVLNEEDNVLKTQNMYISLLEQKN